MERSELEEIMRDWIDGVAINPTTGLPPDAKVHMDAGYPRPYGPIEPGESGPKPGTGEKHWLVTAKLHFPEGSQQEITRVLNCIKTSLQEEPRIHPRLFVESHGTDEPAPRNAPSGYPVAVEVCLSVTESLADG